MREVPMGRFIEGLDRTQTTLLPDTIDDYVSEDNPVRVVDAFVDALDLAALGFDGVIPEETGRPSYHPSTILKIYVYGYLNQVQSSRGLERECHRNLELIWLTGRLAPDFKTIADFRRGNGPGIRKVCAQFIAFCRGIHLLDANIVAIDGSKFKAVNAKAKSFTREKLRRRLSEIDAAIERYMAEVDRADEVVSKTGVHPIEARMARTIKKLAHYRKEAGALRATEQRMDRTGETQVSLTDPDCRVMATTSKQPRVVGYNVQSAVETKHHLIVAHEVTNHGYDRDALSMMARKAREVMVADRIEAIADKGYYKGEEIVACEQSGIAVTVSKPNTSNTGAAGRFDRADFVYRAGEDAYVCPAGKKLIYHYTNEEAGKTLHSYWKSGCESCVIKHRCTTGKERRIKRWEHEDVLERVQKRLDNDPGRIPLRSKTVEHPFGTIKAWMGATHFKMKTLQHVATEMALHVLAYNLKRVMAILGVAGLVKAI
jgi:transposase